MKDRQKRMLRFMLVQKGVLLIDDLAETFTIGRRTVSRDLDILDKWLSLRGARLERKPNQGIQVLCFGNTPEQLQEIINRPDSFLESLSPSVRQKLILLYLLFNNREIKISDISNTFFISDTSVWNDLNHIEKNLEGSSLIIERQKGVGIRLEGEESDIRLKFLATFTEVFSSRTIIPYLYALKEDSQSSLEINQFRLLMKRLKFPESSGHFHKLISETCEELGYHFTMSGEALLYFYLQLTVHRIKSGALLEDHKIFPCIDTFHKLGSSILSSLVERVFSGKLPDSETRLLGLLIQVLEIGDLTSVRISNFHDMINEPVKKITQDMVNEFSKVDNRMYYLNDHMESVLNLALASLVLRLQYNIPYWHGEWGNSSSEEWGREEKEDILAGLLQKQFGLTAEKKDLEYLLLHFYSLTINKKDIPEHRVRCLVCCFEGIGLASYLQSVLQREIKGINIVEATAVFKIRQEYLDEKGIELIISTFPISNLTTPVIPISLPINKDLLKDKISSAVTQIKEKTSIDPKNNNEDYSDTSPSISFKDILSFIQDFDMYTFQSGNDHDEVITQLSNELTDTVKDSQNMSISFKRREDIGPLYFEEYGIRVLHCKTTATASPRAGVLRFEEENQRRMLFMVAPDPCPDEIRKMLSVVTISFLENRSFRNAVMSGGLSLIRKNLMDIYKELI